VRASLVGNLLAALAAAILVLGCASKPYQLMPTPILYQQPSAVLVITQPREARRGSTDVDLLYITDREPETDPESTLPYGQARATSIAFGSARVKIGDGVECETLGRESRLAERTRDLDLSLGQVEEIGRFPNEPNAVEFRTTHLGLLLRRPTTAWNRVSASSLLPPL
jgi:esterase/lipase superfamily enzyme